MLCTRQVSERPAGGKQAKAKDQRVPAEVPEAEAAEAGAEDAEDAATEEADEVEIVDIEVRSTGVLPCLACFAEPLPPLSGKG